MSCFHFLARCTDGYHLSADSDSLYAQLHQTGTCRDDENSMLVPQMI